MDNPKTRCGEHESEVSCTDHAHLQRRSFCHTVTSKLVNSWINEEQLRHRLRFLHACHQVRKRRRMKQWKAEEELDFEGD